MEDKKYFGHLTNGLYVWGAKQIVGNPPLCTSWLNDIVSSGGLQVPGVTCSTSLLCSDWRRHYLTRLNFFDMQSKKLLASRASYAASSGAPLSQSASLQQLVTDFFDSADASTSIEALGEVLTAWIDCIHRDSLDIDPLWASNITHEITRLMAFISQLEKVQEEKPFPETALRETA